MARYGFAKGVLGFTVVIIAVIGTALSGLAMSTTQTTEDVQDWDFITNISGMFDMEQVDQYVEYSPSENWTGFYEYGNPGVTWGIKYDTSASANQYPIKQAVSADSGPPVSTIILSPSLKQESPPTSSGRLDSWGVVYNSTDAFIPITGFNTATCTAKPHVISLQTLYDTLVQTGWLYLTITVGGDSGPIVSNSSDWKYSQYLYNAGAGQIQRYNVYTLNTDYAADSIPTGTIRIAKDTMVASFEDSSGNYTPLTGGLADTYLVYGGTTMVSGYVTIGDQATVTYYNAPDPIYLDPTNGITLDTSSYVRWENGYRTSSIDILFSAPTYSGHYYLSMGFYMDDGNGTDYNHFVQINHKSTGDLVLEVGHSNIYHGVSWNYYDIGKWRTAIVSMDTLNGTITVTPVIRFDNIYSYTTSEPITIDWKADMPYQDRWLSPFKTMWFQNYATISPVFGVLGTDVFMDTYGVVMKDPSVDPYALFPQYSDEGILIDFRSFALYGDSISIAGQRFDVLNGTITLADRTVPLADGLKVYYESQTGKNIDLVVGDVRQTIATTDDPTISFSGNWYMETDVSHSVTRTVDKVEFDFQNFVFDSNMAILAYMGFLAVGTAVAARYTGMSALDLIVVGFAGLCGFVLLG